MNDGEQIWYWRYALRTRSKPNAMAENRDREGALIRDFGGGVGCIHPWPELGDAPLDVQLARLAAGSPTNLGIRALACAEMDGLARRESRNLFGRLKIPPSHWLARLGDDPEAVRKDGFETVKLKGGADLVALSHEIENWMNCNFNIRLDFNESQTISRFLEYWKSGLSDAEKAAIEFVEDPISWNPDDWSKLRDAGVPVAADRDALARIEQADWLIVKPAVVSPGLVVEEALKRDLPVVFTSCMDHAIGQLFAAYAAAEFAAIFPDRLYPAGLLTNEIFKPDPFFEQLTRKGPVLVPPPGTGLGFDDLLDSLPWKKLT